MRIFITGANGFIGGAVAAGLIAGGHDVRGLVRDHAKAEAVRAHGIEPVIGSLDDWPWPDDDEDWEDAAPEPYINPLRHVGRNDPCPCGSGKKFKNCHLVAE